MARKPSIIVPATMSKHVFFGLHGDPGIGKTRLLGTSPGKVLIIRPAQDHLDSLLPADKARVEQAVVSDWDDMDVLLSHLRSDGEQYDWVWVDTASSLFHVLLDDVWASALHRKPERKEFDLDKGEFGINMNRLARWFRHVIGPDKFNFGYTAWSEPSPSPDKDAQGDPIDKLMPWIQGKGMPAMLTGYMNVVAYYHKAKIGGTEGRRVLRTESSINYYAKDLFDAFGGRVVDPTMPKIVDLIANSPGRKAASGSTKRTTASAPRRTIKRR